MNKIDLRKGELMQPTVFISYSRQDEVDKNEILAHLGVLQSQGLIDAWTDDRIAPGADWAAEMEQAIRQARIVILLVTKYFLSSDFALQNEVKRLLERREQEGLVIFPIIARSCAWRTVPWLVKMKVRPRHEQPVWREGGRHADEELAAIAEEIAGIMAQAATPPVPSAPPLSTPADQPGQNLSMSRTALISEVSTDFPSGAGNHLSPQVVFPLREALTRRSLTLFLGADLPRSVTGLPSRADLVRDLAWRKGLDESLSLAEVAQRVSQAGNRWEFTDFIRNALDTTGKALQPFHQRVATLVKQYQIETIITTAYDNLLELAFQQAGVGLNRVVRGSDENFINPDRPTLIKLYGDAQQPDTLVVTDQDHSALLRDRDKEALIDTVRYTFRRNTVFFLGYNLSDPDFRFIFDQVAESRFARTAYAVWSGLPEADVRMWRDRGIVILDTEPLGILGETVVSPMPKIQSEPTVTVPFSSHSGGGNDMDYERGLDIFKKLAEGTGWYQDFIVYEAALRENLRDERRYGPSEQTRRDRTRLVDQLNVLALKHIGMSFNDLCLGKAPPSHSQAGAKGEGETSVSNPLYGAGNRWAVLVGVNHYEDVLNYGELQVCVKDVNAVRKQLIAGGFDPARIHLLTDDSDKLPTRENILAALKSVADATEPDDLLLFYYSGHGEEDDNESYLVARNGRHVILSDTAIRLSRIKEIMEKAPARAKVVILDACHSGANIGSKGPKPMSEEFIRHVFEQAEGLAILASCKQGQLSYEWRAQERSVFTHYWLEALTGQADRDQKGFVTVQDANRYVVNGVKVWAAQRNVTQTPTLQYSVVGDIILSRPATKSSSEISSQTNETLRKFQKVTVSIPLPEGAWGKFEKIAEARGKTPENYLEFLVEMECERLATITDLSIKSIQASWPEQAVEISPTIFERLKKFPGSDVIFRLSHLIQDTK